MIKSKYQFSNAVVTVDKKALEKIHQKSKNIAIYERDMKVLTKEIQKVIDRQIECRANGSLEMIVTQLEQYFSDLQPQCDSLLHDIKSLLQVFKEITQSTKFRLALSTIGTNMCRKFHTDINNLRLLCTYYGPGTLWLPDEAVDHQKLRAKDDEDIVLAGWQIQQVKTGNVAILKGALYEQSNPILHRSPAIEKKGDKRLLLRIDTQEFINFLS